MEGSRGAQAFLLIVLGALDLLVVAATMGQPAAAAETRMPAFQPTVAIEHPTPLGATPFTGTAVAPSALLPGTSTAR